MCKGKEVQIMDAMNMAESINTRISEGNKKIGRIPNINLVPGISCSAAACATCHVSGCYAMKAYTQYDNVRNAWNINTAKAMADLPGMESDIDAYLSHKRKAPYFRIHSAGDFITLDYLKMFIRIAKKYPNTIFMAFTKQFDFLAQVELPDNFRVYVSDWVGIEIPEILKSKYPVAYVIEENESIPENAFVCPGSCKDCKHCWDVHTTVCFIKH